MFLILLFVKTNAISLYLIRSCSAHLYYRDMVLVRKNQTLSGHLGAIFFVDSHLKTKKNILVDKVDRENGSFHVVCSLGKV